MNGIKDRVAIIGVGCSKFGERWDCSGQDLLVEAVYEAYEDAGIDRKDIQAAWLGTTSSGRRGSTLSNALKLEYVPITRVENACATGTDALRNACYAVAAGIYDVVLAAGVEKLKDYGFSGLPSAPPSYAEVATSEVAPSAAAPLQFALAATRYAHHYGLTFEELKTTMAKVAMKNHHNGVKNPKAHLRTEITVEQALKAPMIAWPLGLYDCCGVSDGAAAAIITRAELAKNFRPDPVLVKGLGLTTGANQAQLQSSYDFVHFEETVAAGRMAYAEAGIKNPREEIDLAVVHDCFTITEMLIYEDLGFSARGKAKEDIDGGFFTLEGGLPVNTDGGLKCFGHPIGASGLRMVYEICKQLQEKAGPRQVKNARIGLTHNLGGVPGSFTAAVSILGRAD